MHLAAAAAQQQKIQWGELEEDDGGDLDFLLPPRVVVGPDENGLKKVIECRFDDDCNKVKVTTTSRVRKLAKARLSHSSIERRQWPKFGDVVEEDAGSRLTMVSTKEILLERSRAPLKPGSPDYALFANASKITPSTGGGSASDSTARSGFNLQSGIRGSIAAAVVSAVLSEQS